MLRFFSNKKNSILVVTVVLLYCLTRVESRDPVPCKDFSSDIHFRGQNIAFHRAVSHTPPGGDKYSATLAADGNCDTYDSYLRPTCSATDANDIISPTWTVTLDKSYQITGIVIYHSKHFRGLLGNFTVFGACDGTEKVVLYDDAGHNKYQLDVIQLKINDSHECSSISIQIPPISVSGRTQVLILCEVQVYAAVCSKPTIPFIIDMNPNKSFYNKDESLNLECKPGYLSRKTTVTCCGVDTFCPSPVCCRDLSQPDNGKYLSTSTNTSSEYETTLTGVCDTGYKPEISDTRRTCQLNGTWSGLDSVCTQIICNPPPVIQNGYYIGKTAPFYYNDRMTPTCYVGYSLSINKTIVCAENGWVNSTAMCVPCPAPEETEGLFSTEMFVVTLLGAVVITAIITTTIVCVVIKRLCRRADTKTNNLYGDLALRNTSNEGAYSDLQSARGN